MTRAPGACVRDAPARGPEPRVAATGPGGIGRSGTECTGSRPFRPGTEHSECRRGPCGCPARAAYPARRSGPTLIHPPPQRPRRRPPGCAAPAARPGAQQRRGAGRSRPRGCRPRARRRRRRRRRRQVARSRPAARSLRAPGAGLRSRRPAPPRAGPAPRRPRPLARPRGRARPVGSAPALSGPRPRARSRGAVFVWVAHVGSCCPPAPTRTRDRQLVGATDATDTAAHKHARYCHLARGPGAGLLPWRWVCDFTASYHLDPGWTYLSPELQCSAKNTAPPSGQDPGARTGGRWALPPAAVTQYLARNDPICQGCSLLPESGRLPRPPNTHTFL